MDKHFNITCKGVWEVCNKTFVSILFVFHKVNTFPGENFSLTEYGMHDHGFSLQNWKLCIYLIKKCMNELDNHKSLSLTVTKYSPTVI